MNEDISKSNEMERRYKCSNRCLKDEENKKNWESFEERNTHCHWGFFNERAKNILLLWHEARMKG